MTTKNKLIIILTMMLILIPNSLAYINMHWDTPSQNGEFLTTYPQITRVYVQSNESITNCIHTIDGTQNYHTYMINAQNVDLIKRFNLGGGTYNLTLNCTNGNENTVETISFEVNEVILFREAEERAFNIGLYIFCMIALLIIYIITYESYVGLLSSTLMTVLSIWLTTIIEYSIIPWIPIGVSVLLILNNIFQLYTKKGRKRR